MKYLEKIIEYGLYLLVFILPIQTRWIIKAGELNGGYFEYGTYAVYGTDILLILLLLLFIVREIAAPATLRLRGGRASSLPPAGGAPRNDGMWWFIGGLILSSAVSVLFAASRLLALYKFGWLILGIGLFWLIISANYDRLKLIYAMLAGVFLQAVLGIWQFLFQSSFADKWLGLALHNRADLGTSVVEAVGADGVPGRWLRAYGGTDHPNILGGIVAIGVLILAGEIIKFGKFPSPNDQFPNNFQAPMTNFQTISKPLKIFKIINWSLVLIFSAGLFFSFSRSAWLGLAIGLVIMMILAAVGRNLKLQKGLAEIILVMGALLFILFSQYQNLITSRLAVQGRLEEKSTSERLISYQESWQLIKNNWTTGVGLGNYTLALNRRMPGQASFYYQPTHNVFLLVWAETGIFGIIFFIALLFVIARSVLFLSSSGERQRDQGNQKDEARINLDSRLRGNDKGVVVARNDSKAAILIALVVIMSLDHWLFGLHFGVLFFWLIMGLMLKMSDVQRLRDVW